MQKRFVTQIAGYDLEVPCVDVLAYRVIGLNDGTIRCYCRIHTNTHAHMHANTHMCVHRHHGAESRGSLIFNTKTRTVRVMKNFKVNEDIAHVRTLPEPEGLFVAPLAE